MILREVTWFQHSFTSFSPKFTDFNFLFIESYPGLLRSFRFRSVHFFHSFDLLQILIKSQRKLEFIISYGIFLVENKLEKLP